MANDEIDRFLQLQLAKSNGRIDERPMNEINNYFRRTEQNDRFRIERMEILYCMRSSINSVETNK